MSAPERSGGRITALAAGARAAGYTATAPSPERGTGGTVAAVWALTGVTGLLVFATVRLGRRGIETLQQGLGPTEWTVLVVLTLLFVWMEGRQAFEKRWVPRVIGRTASLRTATGLLERVLAPLYAMSLISDSRRRLLRAWSLTTGIGRPRAHCRITARALARNH